MNYIPYPRLDLDNHADLVGWRLKADKVDGDWTDLKEYLAESARLISGKHPISKCWYCELPQGDDFARDVEHFRPKNQALPLTAKQIKKIENLSGIKYEQNDTAGNYPWLIFDYRNYRIVTAITNRGGAKHIYFPLAKSTTRLIAGQYPWSTNEFPYFLDPTNKHDANLLYVKPNGEIAPIAPKIQLTQTDFDNLPIGWKNDGFNYLRAVVTIELFRLNDSVFKKGRQEVYENCRNLVDMLLLIISENPDSKLIPSLIENITLMALPSAPFSLAAKCALIGYNTFNEANADTENAVKKLINQIITHIENQIKKLVIDWYKP